MADASAYFQAVLASQILPKISDQIIKNCVLLNYGKFKKSIAYKKGGLNMTFRVRNTKSANGGSTDDWTPRQAKTTQPFNTVVAPWASYDWALLTSIFQDIRNQNAGPEAKMFDAEAEQLAEIKQSAMERLGNHAYGDGTALDSADVSTPMNGLQNIIDDDNTYLSIDRSTAANSYWRAQVQACVNFDLDSTGVGVTNGIRAMNTLWNACSVGMQPGEKTEPGLATQREQPDLTVTTSTIHEQYYNSLANQFRYTDETADAVKKLAFNGKPIEWDTFAPSGKLFMLNFSHWNIHTSSPAGSLLQQIGDPFTRGKTKEITLGIAAIQQGTDKPSAQGRMDVTST